MLDALPYTPAGMRVGLLGGSFDPPHAGHLHITQEALRRFRLDRVWWLVSPGNPLKPFGPASLERRLEACRALADDRRIHVTDIEAKLGTRHTAATLARLLPHHPGVRFVWLMGADNLAQFHRWQNWRAIMQMLPLGVLGRPDNMLRAGLSPAARSFSRFRLPEHAAGALAGKNTPAWCLVSGPMVDISSTAIRNSGDWVR